MKEGYTRVTDVLYPLTGLNKIDPEVLKNAAQRGTRVHRAIAAEMQGLGIDTLDDIKGYMQSYSQWDKSLNYIMPERFYCDRLMITGEIDALYKEDDGFVLVDFKTPAKESKTWMLQGSAYAYLAKQAGFHIKRIEFVKLSKDGKPPIVYTYEEDFPLYLKCLDVYRYFFKDMKEENVMDYL